MTILQKPESINLSGNLTDFVITTNSEIAFVLKQGDRTLFEGNYTPNEGHRIVISVKDIIEADLKPVFQDVSEPYLQPELAKTYEAVIADESHKFCVIKAGVDRLATSASNFLQTNWLTWQPQTKFVTYYLPESLTLYSVVQTVVKVKAYFPLPEGGYSEETAQLLSVVAGVAYTVPVQYAVIASKFDSRMPAFYDVWFESESGERLSYVQRYVSSGMKSEDEQWVVFENSLGGFDTFRAYGQESLSAEHDHQLAEVDEVTDEYYIDTKRIYQKNTGFLSDNDRKWLLDFFPSRQKYLYSKNYLRRIVVIEDDTKYEGDELPSSYTFRYRYADAKPYLNLRRFAKFPADLSISIPDLGSFTIPPRLVEFPSQDLSEGVLFPVQNPYSENWATTTIGAILSYVLGHIIDMGSDGSGGVGHSHSNYPLLEALKYVNEYLTVSGKKIKAGYADVAWKIDERNDIYMHKDRPEFTNYLLKLLGGTEIGEFVDSMIAGRGAGIFPNGRGQFERLEVRGSMTVMDLIINQIQGMESDYSFAEIGKIESVQDLGENTYRLKIEKRTEFDFTKFQVEDVCFSIVNTLLTGGSEYYTSWMRVLTVNSQENTLSVVLYPDSEVPGGKNYPPLAGYNLTRRGNSVLPEEGEINERAQSWMLSSSEGRIMFLSNVFKPILEDYNYSISIGKFPKIKALDKLPLSDSETGIMAQTIIAEKFYQYDYNGDIVPNKVDRGKWALEIAQSDKPYRFVQHQTESPTGMQYTLLEQHTVYHLGCKWGCLVDKNTDEPGWNSPSWSLLEGDSNYSLELSLSGTEAFVIGAVDTEMSGRIYYGKIDITDDVMALEGTEVEWFRDSGNTPADNLWTPEYVDDNKLVIHIDNGNIHGVGSDFGFSAKTVAFICRVYIPVGGEIRKIEQRFGFDIL